MAILCCTMQSSFVVFRLENKNEEKYFEEKNKRILYETLDTWEYKHLKALL